jgi:leader peptidase (prepilin peptidase)/N-methyltransferase
VSAWLIVCVSAGLTALLSGLGPRVIARLPEPVADTGAPEKVPYSQLASRPGLALQLGAAGAVVGALVGWRLGDQPALSAWIYVGGVGVVLAYVDACTRLLPTRVVAPSYVVVCALVCVSAAIDADPQRLLRAGLGWLAMGGFYFLLWFIYPRGMGYGDVRLSGLLGIALGYLGWAPLVTGLYSGFLLGAVGGGLLVVLGANRGKPFPFGPFMLLGSLVGVTLGTTLGGWYSSR